MFKVNKKIEYALMALKHMSAKNKTDLTSVKELCESYKMPFDVMSKVMQKLSTSEILHSEKGAHGGYYIIENLNSVNLLDLTEMIIGEKGITSCTCKSAVTCSILTTCNVIGPINDLNERLRSFYKNIKISELLHTKSAI